MPDAETGVMLMRVLVDQVHSSVNNYKIQLEYVLAKEIQMVGFKVPKKNLIRNGGQHILRLELLRSILY